MAMKELGGTLIKSAEDIKRMRQSTLAEREFARLLLEKTNLTIEYEPVFFHVPNGEGIPTGTVPDFKVTNPTTGVCNFIEITTSPNPEAKDRQRRIMRGEGLEKHYKVFFGDKLAVMQEKFPEYNLTHNQALVISK